ncbi:MFS transporter, partial [Paenibacillus sp. 28ISP30-2]|nr:MFS transporter [Paenibacillus sp. 28ISP30-2]
KPIRWIFVLNGGMLLVAALLLWVKGRGVFHASAPNNTTDRDVRPAG